MSDERFDDAVDRVVREMLDVEPRADLRARVMARIEERHAASGFDASHVASAFRRKFWLIGAPIAAAAIIVLAVLIARRDAAVPAPAPTAPPSIVQRTPPSAQPLPTPPSVTAENAGTGRNARPQQVAAERGGPSPRTASIPVNRLAAGATVGAASTDATTVDVEPLKGVAPISVAVVRPATIEDTEIAVRPLRPIADMQVAPLSPSERRH